MKGALWYPREAFLKQEMLAKQDRMLQAEAIAERPRSSLVVWESQTFQLCWGKDGKQRTAKDETKERWKEPDHEKQ